MEYDVTIACYTPVPLLTIYDDDTSKAVRGMDPNMRGWES